MQAVERGFLAGVADRLGREPFTYSDRQALLAAGQHLGLDRFRVNLLLAARQHEASRPGPWTGEGRLLRSPPRPGRPADAVRDRRRADSRPVPVLAIVTVVVALQAGIAAVAVWACTA